MSKTSDEEEQRRLDEFREGQEQRNQEALDKEREYAKLHPQKDDDD